MGMRWSAGTVLRLGIVIASLLWLPVYGLFEEQDGKYNWIEKYIGEYALSTYCGNRFVVATHDGVLASIKASDGSIVWRAVFQDGDDISQIECHANVVVAVARGRSHVLAFGAHGEQIWEARIRKNSRAYMRILRNEISQNIVIIANGAQLSARSLHTGQLLWESSLPGMAAMETLLLDSENYLEDAVPRVDVLVTGVRNNGFVELRYRSSNGEAVGSAREGMSKDAVEALMSVAVNGSVYAPGKDRKVICFFPPNQGSPLCSQLEGIEDIVTLQRGCGRSVVVVSHSTLALVDMANEPKVLFKMEYAGNASECSSDGHMLVSSGNGEVVLLNMDQQESKPPNVLSGVEHMIPRTVSGEVLPVKSVTMGTSGRWIVQFTDGTALGGKIGDEMHATDKVWVRRDGLASIQDSMFVDLPPSSPESEEAWLASQPRTSQKLFIQLLTLKSQLGLGKPDDMILIEKHRALTSDLRRPTRDPDGFRRQLVVASAQGKVASLHSGDGRTLWEVNFDGSPKLLKWFESEDVEEIGVLLSSNEGMEVHILDVYTGKRVGAPIRVSSPDGNPLELITSGDPIHVKNTYQHVYIVLDSKDRVLQILPPTDYAKESFVNKSPHLVRWKFENDRKSLRGMRMKFEADAVTLWTVNLIPEGSDMEVLDVAKRDPNEVIYSAARAVSGGGVLMKSINPNLLFVLTGTKSEKGKGMVVATAIDAVTGAIIYQQRHDGARGPAHGIVSENWAAYIFWNEKETRWNIGVVDSYFPQPADLTALQILLNSGFGNETFSAYDAQPELILERTSFRTKLSASCLAVTQTAHGTAAKMLLLGTPSGQIYSIDRRMIDPRRPVVLKGAKPTEEQMYEGLPLYNPELPYAGPSFVTLRHKIGRLRHIKTSAAILESYSLVFAYGLDLYFIRLQPSKGFDTVPDDFPHAMLVAMVLGLGASLVALRAVIQRRNLKLKWQ